jgi:hypothetical protein
MARLDGGGVIVRDWDSCGFDVMDAGMMTGKKGWEERPVWQGGEIE